MKKNIIKTIIILIQIIICYIICEFSCFCLEIYRVYEFDNNGLSPIEYFNKSKKLFLINEFTSYEKAYKKIVFRKIAGEKYNNKKSIILFGCSFVDGTILKDNQIFSYKLSELTKRKVYTRAISGGGIQNMLYQLRRKDFYDIIKEEPEFIIYTYINNHLYRLYGEVWPLEPQVFYKKTYKNTLKESLFVPGNFVFYGFFAKQIRRIIAKEKIKDENDNYQFMLKHFEESEKEIKKHWKNTKFVIFVYNIGLREKRLFKKMQKEKGLNVIFVDELTNINFDSLEYQLSESDTHPNEKAWDKIVPLLVKKLNIK